jgi:hypothetical protein
MPIGIVGQIGKSNYPFKISPMSVNVAGYSQAALRRQVHQITTSELIRMTGFYALV